MPPSLTDQASPADIIWIQTSFLGDIVLSTGAFALVRHAFPNARQHVITTAVGKELLVGESGIDHLWEFKKRHGLGFWRESQFIKESLAPIVTDSSSAVVLLAHRSLRSSFLAKRLGYRTIAYREAAGSRLADVRIQRIAVMHETGRVGLLLEPLGVDRAAITAVRPTLAASQVVSERAWAQVFADGRRTVLGICPGSVWGTKKWQVEKYAAICKLMLEKNEQSFLLLLGSRAEKDDTARISQVLHESGYQSGHHFLDLAGQTTLHDLKGIYPRLNFILTNDSSPMHFASAFDVPTVAIFGSTVPAMGFGPLASSSQVVENQALNCRPCSDHGPQRCPLGHFKCMRDIEVEMVWNAIQKMRHTTANG